MDINQSFIKLHPLIDNSPNKVSPVGELSDYASTFVKDKTSYMDSSVAPGVEIVCFKSMTDNQPIGLPARSQMIALKLSLFLLTRFQTNTLGEEIEPIRKAVLQEFQGDITAISIGDLVDCQTKKFPSRVVYTINDAGKKNEHTLWYEDAAFRRQFTDYTFDIIAPFENLDLFFGDPLTVKEAIEAEALSERLTRVNNHSGDYPYTLLRVYTYPYFDPKDPTYSLTTEWIVIIWGLSGDNPDIITRAVKEFILANSTHKEDEWAKILPDIFRSNEMVFVPLWNKYAIENKELQAGMHSPVIFNPSDIETVVAGMSDAKYTRDWLNGHLEYFHLNYRSLAVGVVGHPDSRDNVFRFTDKFRDYISVTNTSADFNRMSPPTQTIVRHLENMVKLAETTTDKTDTNLEYPRIIRNGIVYISKVLNNKTYLVVCKVSIPNSGFKG